jgi:hypothetical protein
VSTSPRGATTGRLVDAAPAFAFGES